MERSGSAGPGADRIAIIHARPHAPAGAAATPVGETLDLYAAAVAAAAIVRPGR